VFGVRYVASLSLIVLGMPVLAGTNTLFTFVKGLPRNTDGVHLPTAITWSMSGAIQNVRAVFPHTEADAIVYALCADGLWRSDDTGMTWRHLPLSTLARPADITDIAFRPGEPETLALGTRAAGIWVSTDGGRTARRIGSQVGGLASDAVTSLCFYPGDPFLRTLLAAHGAGGRGLSRGSIDETAWTTTAADYHVTRLFAGLPGQRGIYLFAAEKNDPDNTGVYYAPMLGMFWQRLVSNILPTDGARARLTDAFYVTTLDRGVLRISGSGVVESLGGSDHEWFSAGIAWGRHADEEIACLYEPAQRGFVTTTSDLATSTTPSQGLFTGAFVSEDSRIRANAGGVTFYGAINGVLWLGRPDGPLRVDHVAVTPSVLMVAATVFDDDRWRTLDEDLRELAVSKEILTSAADLVAQLRVLDGAVPDGDITVQARVTAPAGTPVAVTVDLSRLNQSPQSPLYDDGAHGDGAARDGVFGAAFAVTRERLKRWPDDWRPAWPGGLPVAVTARVSEGSAAGGVGVFALYVRPESFSFWHERGGLQLRTGEGTVDGGVINDAKRAALGTWYLQLNVGPGAWQTSFGSRTTRNVSDYYALSFLIRSQGPADGELFVCLRDNRNDAFPTTTPAVPIIAGGFIAGGAVVPTAYRRVTVPLATLLEGAEEFMPEQFGWVVFGGDSATQRTYLIDDIRFILNRSETVQEASVAR
jgi:hypothetical protein